MKITAESIEKSVPTKKNPSLPNNKKPKDKKPKDKKPKDKKPMGVRDKLIVGGVVVVAIVSTIVIKSVFFPTVEVPVPENKQEEKPKEEIKKEEPKDEVKGDVIEEAKGGLERPDETISAEASADGKVRLQEGLDYLISLNGEDFIPTRCAAWQNTLPAKAFQVQEALTLGYTMDIENSQWFDSDAKQKNVYQFIVKMRKDGESDIAFSGNYVTGTRSVNISVMTGEINNSQFASPGGGQQALDPGTE